MVNMAKAFGTGFQVNATEYYILCEGGNPMGDLLLDADSALETFKSGLEQTIQAGCAQTAAYDNLIGSIDTSKNLVESVIVDASCKNLNPYMQK